MKPILPAALLVSLGLVQAQDTGPKAPAERRISLSARDADLKDVLRAATEQTDINLSFEQGLDTRVRGLDLKDVTLDELLEQVLPNLGLGHVKKGRTLFIHKSDGGLRFYQVDHLSMRREGSKEFMVNASGQLIQSTGGGGGGGQTGGGGGGGSQGGGGGQGGQSSAYMSSLNSGNGFDPWRELQAGLTTLVFGDPAAVASPEGGSGQMKGPVPMAFAKDGKTLMIQPDSGLVVVGADPATHARVERYLNELKRRNRRQVLLEARIVEVTLANDSQIGVDWNGVLMQGGASGAIGTDIASSFAAGQTLNPNVLAADGLFKFTIQNARLSATLSALAREGRLQVLSTPRVSTLNNQKAILRVVREEAFFLQSSQVTAGGGLSGAIATVQITPVVVPVGIVLDIQPQVGDDGSITLAVNPSVSEIVTVRNFQVPGPNGTVGASATLPVVDRRDLDAVVRVRPTETLVLAGIIRTKESMEDRGIPWLRRIPILGQLFSKREKSKSHTELAIFITPTLVEDPDQIKAEADRVEDRLKKAAADPKPAAPRKKAPLSTP